MNLDYLNINHINNGDLIKTKYEEYSNLVDPKILNFFSKNLKKCHEFKNNYYTFVYNMIYLLIFISIVFLILFIKYKGQKNSYENKIKQKKEKEYILAKLIHINKMSQQNSKNNLNLITDLPSFNF